VLPKVRGGVACLERGVLPNVRAGVAPELLGASALLSSGPGAAPFGACGAPNVNSPKVLVAGAPNVGSGGAATAGELAIAPVQAEVGAPPNNEGAGAACGTPKDSVGGEARGADAGGAVGNCTGMGRSSLLSSSPFASALEKEKMSGLCKSDAAGRLRAPLLGVNEKRRLPDDAAALPEGGAAPPNGLLAASGVEGAAPKSGVELKRGGFSEVGVASLNRGGLSCAPLWNGAAGAGAGAKSEVNAAGAGAGGAFSCLR